VILSKNKIYPWRLRLFNLGSAVIFDSFKPHLFLLKPIYAMEIATLTTFISPFLPFLLKLGEKAAEKSTESAAGKFGEASWSKAQAVWQMLNPKVEAKDSAKEAVIDVANAPEDEDLQIALRVQLKKLLAQDEVLANVIAQIFQEDVHDRVSGTRIVQNVTGDQNQMIGQVSGGQVFGNVQGNVSKS
jgi:hypothetical protein